METQSIIKLDKKTTAQIKSVTALIGKSYSLPILECAKAENGDLIFTDLETHVIIKNVGIAGHICIPSAALNNVLKLMPEFHTELDLDTDQITFISPDGSERLKVTGESADDFPRLPDVTSAEEIGALSEQTVAQLKIAENFVGKDELRIVMMCVVFTDGLIAATDAHTLYWEPTDFKPLFPVLVPLKARKFIQLFHTADDPIIVSLQINSSTDEAEIAHLGRITTGMKESGSTQKEIETYLYSATPGTIILENSRVKIFYRKLDERYPDFQAVIPQDNPNGFIIAKDTLAGPLVKAISQANQTHHQVRFKLTPSGLSIHSEDIDFATAYSKDFGTSAEVQLADTDELEIGFSGKFIEKILSHAGEVITVRLSAPNRAAVINGCFLIMPQSLNAQSR